MDFSTTLEIEDDDDDDKFAAAAADDDFAVADVAAAAGAVKSGLELAEICTREKTEEQ